MDLKTNILSPSTQPTHFCECGQDGFFDAFP